MSKKLRIRLTFTLPCKITKRKKWVLASCPILDVHSQGENENKAKKNLGEALSLFFISCIERGTINDVMKECGFTPISPSSIKKPFEKDKNFIDVSIPFKVLNQCQPRAAG